MAGKKGVKRGPQVSDKDFVNEFLAHRIVGSETADAPLGYLEPGAYEKIADNLGLKLESVQMRASRMRTGGGNPDKALPLPELQRTVGGRSRDTAGLLALISQATGADVDSLKSVAAENAEASAARAAKREAAKANESK